MIGLMLAVSILAQAAERVPKTMTDAERMNDKVLAAREYDKNARAVLSPRFREALDRASGFPPLRATWGEFITVDGVPFIALQLALPAATEGGRLILFGVIRSVDGKQIASYNEPIAPQTSKDDTFVERSLIVPLQKCTGVFGLSRRNEIIGMTGVEFDPERLLPAAAGVSRLIVSRDVHRLHAAQRPLDPFAFGGTKVVPRPGAVFDRAEEMWIFAEVRNPAIGEDGVPHVVTKVTLEGPSKISGPAAPAETTPLKGMPGRFGIGNPIDISRLAPGDYTLRVVFTDLVAKRSFARETQIHIH